jgi:signal peptidase I
MPIKHVIVFQNVQKSFNLNRDFGLKRRLTRFRSGSDEKLSVINNLSFKIKQFDTIGLFGPNGSGKSTILRLISGILRPDSGIIRTYGKIAPILELGSGLHPELTGLDNIFLYASILGISKKHIDEYLKKIIGFSELLRFINLPLKKYSTGMKARLAFSVAVFSDADILLLDEVLAVGDIAFRDKCLLLLKRLNKSKTIIFTSQDLGLMQMICDQVMILENGNLVNEQNENTISFIKNFPEDQSFKAEAKSNSMYPIIKKGDNILIKKIVFPKIKSGDIIAFYLKNIPEIIVHRVVSVIKRNGTRELVTKGDNANGMDSWRINRSNYLGSVSKSDNLETGGTLNVLDVTI